MPFDAKPILDRYIDRDFEVFACGQDAPAKAVVREFEKRVGFSLPADFIDFSISPLGGVYLAVKEEFWPRPKEFQVGPFWSFLYGLHTMGFGKDIPDWMDIQIQRERFKQDTRHDVVPFLKVIGDADVYCFTSSQEVVRWDHETDVLEPQKKTFADVLEYEIAELKKRRERKKAEPDGTANAGAAPQRG